MNEPLILLFRGRGLISALIRWQTRSEFSHAAILLPNGRMIEAWPGAGVRVTTLKDWRGVSAFRVAGVTDAQWMRAIDFAYAQVGCGYDYLGVLRFLTRTTDARPRFWFCSELVFAAFKSAGVRLLCRIQPCEVSPAELSLSTLLLKPI